MDNSVQSKPVTGVIGQQANATIETLGIPESLIPDSQGIPRVEGSHGNHQSQTASELQGIPRSEGCVIPTQNQPALNKPTDAEKEWEAAGKRRKGKRLAGNSQSSTLDPKPPLLGTDLTNLNPIPQTKPPVKKVPRTYLWNARSRKKQVPMDITPPKIIEIDKIPIYAQFLTSEQAAELDVKGWDKVLADIVGLNVKVAEDHIAVFWASWKQQLQLTQKANAQKQKDEKSNKIKTGTLPAIPAIAVNPSSPQPSTSTPSGGGEKRKHSGTPASTELAGKCNYAAKVMSGGAGSATKSKPKVHILWVHSNQCVTNNLVFKYFGPNIFDSEDI